MVEEWEIQEDGIEDLGLDSELEGMERCIWLLQCLVQLLVLSSFSSEEHTSKLDPRSTSDRFARVYR